MRSLKLQGMKKQSEPQEIDKQSLYSHHKQSSQGGSSNINSGNTKTFSGGLRSTEINPLLMVRPGNNQDKGNFPGSAQTIVRDLQPQQENVTSYLKVDPSNRVPNLQRNVRKDSNESEDPKQDLQSPSLIPSVRKLSPYDKSFKLCEDESFNFDDMRSISGANTPIDKMSEFEFGKRTIQKYLEEESSVESPFKPQSSETIKNLDPPKRSSSDNEKVEKNGVFVRVRPSLVDEEAEFDQVGSNLYSRADSSENKKQAERSDPAEVANESEVIEECDMADSNLQMTLKGFSLAQIDSKHIEGEMPQLERSRFSKMDDNKSKSSYKKIKGKVDGQYGHSEQMQQSFGVKNLDAKEGQRQSSIPIFRADSLEVAQLKRGRKGSKASAHKESQMEELIDISLSKSANPMDELNIMESQIDIKTNTDALSLTKLGQNLRIVREKEQKAAGQKIEQEESQPLEESEIVEDESLVGEDNRFNLNIKGIRGTVTQMNYSGDKEADLFRQTGKSADGWR